MDVIIKLLLVLFVVPILGCLLAGIDRILTARLQHRVGPPLLQPLYDVIKLFHKENIVVNRFQNLYILAYFIFIILSLIMFILKMDLLMIIFVYTIANVALIVGAMSTGSPYSRIGSARETISMLAYEPILLFYIVGMYMLTGSFKISSLDHTTMPLVLYLPLIFVSVLFIMTIKFKKSPFDFSTSHHAHQELVKGMMTEYSGPALALIEIAHWYEYVFLLGLIYLFYYPNVWIATIIAFVTFILEIVIDNVSARLSWEWMLRFTWTIVVGLSVANILFIYLFNIKIV